MCCNNQKVGMNKVVIFSAPSGSGKSTIIHQLLQKGLGLEFSVSATCRKPRGEEKDGREYYFFTPDEFQRKIAEDAFLEYEEVYHGCFYGTLKSEVERIWADGKTVLFDIDVAGCANLKKKFGANAFSVFIQPPSIDVLRQRLMGRGTETPEKVEERVAKAAYEMTFSKDFDTVVVNDRLEDAVVEAEQKIRTFLSK